MTKYCVLLFFSNEGNDSQVLLSCSFLNQVANAVSQFEIGPVQLDSVNLEHASCKAQQLLPITIGPGKSASLLVYFSARFVPGFKLFVM
jgi:hypothetical protein